MSIVTAIFEHLYVSLCISEGFVIVAYVADGYLGVSVQQG